MPTILCIDDEHDALGIRKMLLESEGYRVLEARTGEEGLHTLESNRVDLAVIDYWMSGMNGLILAAEIRNRNRAIPIIILSGFGELPGEAVGIVDRWILKGRPTEEF